MGPVQEVVLRPASPSTQRAHSYPRLTERPLRLLQMVGGLALLVLAIAFGSILVPLLLGWQSLVVYSGSMEPTIPVGSIVVLQPVAPAQLQVGDVVTFARTAEPGVQVTHRIVG